MTVIKPPLFSSAVGWCWKKNANIITKIVGSILDRLVGVLVSFLMKKLISDRLAGRTIFHVEFRGFSPVKYHTLKMVRMMGKHLSITFIFVRKWPFKNC